MTWLLAISVVGALMALVLASILPFPAWLRSLEGLAACLAVAAFAAVGVAVGRPWVARRLGGARPLALPVVGALAALACRAFLVAQLSPPEPLPRIDFTRLQLGAVALTGAAFGLVGGVLSLGRSPGWPRLIVAASCVTAALYTLGPVLLWFGVPLDHRAFLSLAALGVVAYVIVEAGRRIRRARGGHGSD